MTYLLFRNASEQNRSWISGSRIEIDFRSPQDFRSPVENVACLTTPNWEGTAYVPHNRLVQSCGNEIEKNYSFDAYVLHNFRPILWGTERTISQLWGREQKTNYSFDAYVLPHNFRPIVRNRENNKKRIIFSFKTGWLSESCDRLGARSTSKCPI